MMKTRSSKLFFVIFFQSVLIFPAFVLANNPSIQEKNIPDSQPSIQNEIKSEQSGEKGGVYAVGREFKEAGGEIKKGGETVGQFFSGIGRSVKNFFTGGNNQPKETPSNEPNKSDPLDHRGDEVK